MKESSTYVHSFLQNSTSNSLVLVVTIILMAINLISCAGQGGTDPEMGFMDDVPTPEEVVAAIPVPTPVPESAPEPIQLPSAGIIINKSGTEVSEDGSTVMIHFTLKSAPTSEVTINILSDDETEGVLSDSVVSFSAADWNLNKTIIVEGVNDDLLDGDLQFNVVIDSVVSADSSYNGLTVNSESFTNVDNDSAGIIVSAISGNTSENGTLATFTVVLNSAPSEVVTIGLLSNDISEGAPLLASLSFDQSDWDTVKTVTVTGLDDLIVDGTVAYQIDLTVSSSDTNYDNFSLTSVDINNIDDDSAGIIVSAISGDTSENGTSAIFTVVLSSEPSASVTIDLVSNNLLEGTPLPASLSFDQSDWNTVKTVTVIGLDDLIVDGIVAYQIGLTVSSSDTNYDNFLLTSVDVNNIDDDSAGIIVSAISGDTSENGTSATFTVVLNSAPAEVVTIDLLSSNELEGTPLPASLSFDQSNWNIVQTVTVNGIDDLIVDGTVAYQIGLTVSSSDINYDNFSLTPVDVNNIDDDIVGIIVSAISGDTSENGTSATFSVVLNSKPTEAVTINSLSSNELEGTLLPASLSFDQSNWNIVQTVTVTGIDDLDIDGNIAYQVSLTVVSGDINYDNFSLTSVDIINLDNDFDNDNIGFLIAPITDLHVTESGGTDTFTMRLLSPPTAEVSVFLTSDNNNEGTVNPSMIYFDESNWDTPQVVTVTGVDDFDLDGSQAFKIITGAASSSDAGYNGLNPMDIDVINADNDLAGITVTKAIENATCLLVNESGDITDSVKITLDKQPTDDVVIPLSVSEPNEIELSAPSLTFTAENWDVPQTVVVTGVQDSGEADEVSTNSFVFEPAISADSDFDGLNADDITVYNYDDDSADIIISPMKLRGDRTSLLTVGEDGSSETFSIVLTMEPTAEVTMTISSGDSTQVVVDRAEVVFDSTNWNIPQIITVTGVEDDIVDGDQLIKITVGKTSSSDSDFNRIRVADPQITVLDND